MGKLKGIILVVLYFVFTKSFGQDKYWVFFKERDLGVQLPISERTKSNRQMLNLPVYQESDFGPKNEDLRALLEAGFLVENTSRWFNAVSIYLPENEVSRVLALPFVKGIRRITNYQNLTSPIYKRENEDGIYLSFPLHQINSGAFIEKGWLGQSVDIGVIDGGFFDAPKDLNLSHLFDKKQIIATKDFFTPPKSDFFGEKKSEGEIHGTMVTTAIAGFNPDKKQLFGLALKSNFYFARTESSQRESRIEEDNWIAAIEWLDSLGVRLANSSLGYATGFTDPTESYSPEQMDGATSLIAKGAKMAVNEKGMILVVSAGNEGDNAKWGGVVSTPGDVEEVISVGANDEQGMKMSYSSKGVERVQFVKPDVTVYSQFGTSLAAPIVTGLVAGMLQKKPNLSASEVKVILRQSSLLSGAPNNFVGYGFPDAAKIVVFLEGKNLKVKQVEVKKAKKQFLISTTQKDGVVVFHKIDAKNVASQQVIQPAEGKIELQKPNGVNISTVVLQDKLIEVKWKN